MAIANSDPKFLFEAYRRQVYNSTDESHKNLLSRPFLVLGFEFTNFAEAGEEGVSCLKK